MDLLEYLKQQANLRTNPPLPETANTVFTLPDKSIPVTPTTAKSANVATDTGWKVEYLIDAVIRQLDWQRWRMESKREQRVKAMVRAQQNRQNRDKSVENKGVL